MSESQLALDLGHKPALGRDDFLVAPCNAEAVAWLEGPHEPKHYSIDDLKQIKAQYRAMTRELQRAGEG